MHPRHRKLNNPPLVEALFEFRWRAKDVPTPKAPIGQSVSLNPMEPVIEPHHDLLLGMMFSELRKKGYPHHEVLPTANLPQALVPHIAQHRFRTAEGAWPLVQLGPGILTVNDARRHEYEWGDFSARITQAVKHLFEVHPSRENIKGQSLKLQYIDAEPHNPERDDTFRFLRENLHLSIDLPSGLFAEGLVTSKPTGGLNLLASFPTSDPKGKMALQVASGTHHGQPAILWNTIFTSSGDSTPTMPSELSAWLEAAHELCHQWFEKMVAGPLERKYQT